MANKFRINATMDLDLLARIDAYGEKMGLNRSAAISVLAAQALDGQDGLRALVQLADDVRKEQQAKASQTDQSVPPPA